MQRLSTICNKQVCRHICLRGSRFDAASGNFSRALNVFYGTEKKYGRRRFGKWKWLKQMLLLQSNESSFRNSCLISPPYDSSFPKRQTSEI